MLFQLGVLLLSTLTVAIATEYGEGFNYLTSNYSYAETKDAPSFQWNITLGSYVEIESPPVEPGVFLMTSNYTLDDRHYNIEIYESDCLSPITGEGGPFPIAIKTVHNDVDSVTKKNDIGIEFIYDQNKIEKSSIWSSNKTGGSSEFCVRLNNYLSMGSDDYAIQISFHETKYRIDVDLTTNYNMTISVDRIDAIDGGTETINYEETIDAFICDENFQQNQEPNVFTQGDFAIICVRTANSSNFGVHSIKELTVSQGVHNRNPYSYIIDFESSVLAATDCDQSNRTIAICKAKIQLLGTYFAEDDPDDLSVKGTVKLDYVGVAGTELPPQTEAQPTSSPTKTGDAPSDIPSLVPTEVTSYPTKTTASLPSLVPTIANTTNPSDIPSDAPSAIPSLAPTIEPPRFGGVQDAFSFDRGVISIKFHPPLNSELADLDTISYDVFLARGEFNFSQVLENDSIPQLIDHFDSNSDYLHENIVGSDLELDEELVSYSIDLNSSYPGEVHELFMTAKWGDSDTYSTNIVSNKIVVSSVTPKLKEDVRFISFFVPTSNISIHVDEILPTTATSNSTNNSTNTTIESNNGPFYVVFSHANAGGPFNNVTGNLTIGDVISGMDSNAIMFTRQIVDVTLKNESMIVLEVIYATATSAFEDLDFDATMSDQDNADLEERRRRLGFFSEVTNVGVRGVRAANKVVGSVEGGAKNVAGGISDAASELADATGDLAGDLRKNIAFIGDSISFSKEENFFDQISRFSEEALSRLPNFNKETKNTFETRSMSEKTQFVHKGTKLPQLMTSIPGVDSAFAHWNPSYHEKDAGSIGGADMTLSTRANLTAEVTMEYTPSVTAGLSLREGKISGHFSATVDYTAGARLYFDGGVKGTLEHKQLLMRFPKQSKLFYTMVYVGILLIPVPYMEVYIHPMLKLVTKAELAIEGSGSIGQKFKGSTTFGAKRHESGTIESTYIPPSFKPVDTSQELLAKVTFLTELKLRLELETGIYGEILALKAGPDFGIRFSTTIQNELIGGSIDLLGGTSSGLSVSSLEKFSLSLFFNVFIAISAAEFLDKEETANEESITIFPERYIFPDSRFEYPLLNLPVRFTVDITKQDCNIFTRRSEAILTLKYKKKGEYDGLISNRFVEHTNVIYVGDHVEDDWELIPQNSWNTDVVQLRYKKSSRPMPKPKGILVISSKPLIPAIDVFPVISKVDFDKDNIPYDNNFVCDTLAPTSSPAPSSVKDTIYPDFDTYLSTYQETQFFGNEKFLKIKSKINSEMQNEYSEYALILFDTHSARTVVGECRAFLNVYVSDVSVVQSRQAIVQRRKVPSDDLNWEHFITQSRVTETGANVVEIPEILVQFTVNRGDKGKWKRIEISSLIKPGKVLLSISTNTFIEAGAFTIHSVENDNKPYIEVFPITEEPSLTPSTGPTIPPTLYPSVSHAPSYTSANIYASQGAYVRGGYHSSTNYGDSQGRIEVKRDEICIPFSGNNFCTGSFSTQDRIGYLYFDDTTFVKTVEGNCIAHLHIYILDVRKWNGVTVRINSLDPSQWLGKDHISYDNRPQRVDEIGPSFTLSSSDENSWKVININSLMRSRPGKLLLEFQVISTQGESSSFALSAVINTAFIDVDPIGSPTELPTTAPSTMPSPSELAEAVMHTKFSEYFGKDLNTTSAPFSLEGTAEIKMTDDFYGALRIVDFMSFAKFPNVDINPSSMPNCTLMIGLKLAEIVSYSNGYVMGNENGTFSRGILMHASDNWGPTSSPSPYDSLFPSSYNSSFSPTPDYTSLSSSPDHSSLSPSPDYSSLSPSPDYTSLSSSPDHSSLSPSPDYTSLSSSPDHSSLSPSPDYTSLSSSPDHSSLSPSPDYTSFSPADSKSITSLMNNSVWTWPWKNPRSPPVDEWIHITVTYQQGGETKMYFNGLYGGITETNTTNNDGLPYLMVGSADSLLTTQEWWYPDAWIREVAVFDSALDAYTVKHYSDKFFHTEAIIPPTPTMHTKFIDYYGTNDMTGAPFSLNGNAYIEITEDGYGALRILDPFSFAMFPNIDISPSSMENCTLMIGIKLYDYVMNDAYVIGNEGRGILMQALGFENETTIETISAILGDSFWTWPWDIPRNTPMDEWLHVTVTYEQGYETKMYLNGEYGGKTVTNTTSNDGLSHLMVGSSSITYQYADAWIREVAVFDSALDPWDVKHYSDEFFLTFYY